MLKKSILSLSLAASLVASDDYDIKVGEQLYTDTCASCHGIDGNGNKQMKLVVNSRKLTKTILTQEQSYFIIKDGAHHWGSHADIMPAFKFVYNEFQLRSLSHYISKEFNKDIKKKINTLYNQSKKVPENKKADMLNRGKKIYNRNCTWCHGKEGKGNGEATKNPIDSIYPYDLTKTLLTSTQMFLYAKEGGHFWGTFKDDMPYWKKKYDDYTLKSVIKYIDVVIRDKSKKEQDK